MQIRKCYQELPIMENKMKKGYKELIEEANSLIETISIETAMSIFDNDDYSFIDLRDFRELKRSGKIPGSFSCPRGMLEFWIDPESPYHKDIFSQEKHFVFYCASAWRSALATKTALEMGLPRVSHIEGGFTAWIRADGKIEQLT